MNDGFKARKGSKKIVDIELQYEEENDKTLLQVAVDEGKVEALQVTILGTYHSIFFSFLYLTKSLSIELNDDNISQNFRFSGMLELMQIGCTCLQDQHQFMWLLERVTEPF